MSAVPFFCVTLTSSWQKLQHSMLVGLRASAPLPSSQKNVVEYIHNAVGAIDQRGKYSNFPILVELEIAGRVDED